MELETRKRYYRMYGIAMPDSEIWSSYNAITKRDDLITSMQLIRHYEAVMERIQNNKRVLTIGDLNPQLKKFLR